MSDFHATYTWQKSREAIMKHYKGLCADPFGIHINKGMLARNIVLANVVHHIVPLDIDETKATLQSNLVPLCDNCHELAHRLLSTPQGRIEYRKAFKLSVDINLCRADKNRKEQPFFSKEKCYSVRDKYFCVRCNKLKDRPCPTCKNYTGK